MINRCKVEMKGGELYNVMQSPKEGDGKTVLRPKEKRNIRNRGRLEKFFLCLLSSATTLSMHPTEQAH